MVGKINNYIQRRMQRELLDDISLTEAARWLDGAGILKDSATSPGYPLRRHVHKGNVMGAYRKNNYYWRIRRIEDYEEVLTVAELTRIFGLKSRTSLYRKIRREHIPFQRHRQKGIYFPVSEILRWAVEQNKTELFEKIQERTTH
ncbi:MAG: helix-turn-helix domain-containing protein [Calditrichia bacterium]